MTDLSLARSRDGATRRVASPARRLPWPAILYAAVGTAGVFGLVAGRLVGSHAVDMEWQLALLLRFMAVVKGAMVLGALGLTQWRMRRPVADRLALGYSLTLAAMATSPGLIWSLAGMVPGALLFHAGLVAWLVLAWRDDAVALPRRRP